MPVCQVLPDEVLVATTDRTQGDLSGAMVQLMSSKVLRAYIYLAIVRKCACKATTAEWTTASCRTVIYHQRTEWRLLCCYIDETKGQLLPGEEEGQEQGRQVVKTRLSMRTAAPRRAPEPPW